MPLALEALRDDPPHVLDESDHADDGRRQDAAPFGLVVERDVAGDDRRLEGPHASAMPSMTSEKAHITSGRSGDAKLRQFVTASGRAPTQTTLRAASATIRLRALARVDGAVAPVAVEHMASARRVSLMRTTAASAPGSTAVFVRTMWSYCR